MKNTKSGDEDKDRDLLRWIPPVFQYVIAIVVVLGLAFLGTTTPVDIHMLHETAPPSTWDIVVIIALLIGIAIASHYTERAEKEKSEIESEDKEEQNVSR